MFEKNLTFYNGQGLKDRKNIKAQNTDFKVIYIYIIMLKYKTFNLERKGLDQDDVLKKYFYSPAPHAMRWERCKYHIKRGLKDCMKKRH